MNLPADRDLTFIFERDDVKDAFAGHCAMQHLDAQETDRCGDCSEFRLVLANAIIEWLGIVEQDRAAQLTPQRPE